MEVKELNAAVRNNHVQNLIFYLLQRFVMKYVCVILKEHHNTPQDGR